MKVTSKEFEKFMTRLDKDPTVTPKEQSTILKKMSTCKNWKEFNEFLNSIAVDKDRNPVRKKRKTANAM